MKNKWDNEAETKRNKIEDTLAVTAITLFAILLAMMIMCTFGKPTRDPVHQQIHEESMIF